MSVYNSDVTSVKSSTVYRPLCLRREARPGFSDGLFSQPYPGASGGRRPSIEEYDPTIFVNPLDSFDRDGLRTTGADVVLFDTADGIGRDLCQFGDLPDTHLQNRSCGPCLDSVQRYTIFISIQGIYKHPMML